MSRMGFEPTSYTQNNTNTEIHVSNGIRTHDPSVQEDEDSSCFRPRGHCDRLAYSYIINIKMC
jgi:hypothetical protein